MLKIKKNKNEVQQRENDIGSFLKKARSKKNMTQQELATILDISPKTISKWENNNGFPDPLLQIPLCESLGITLEELHYGRINIAVRNKEKKENRIKIILVSFIIVFLISIVIFHVRIIYYKYHYNPLAFYYIDVTYDDQTVCNIDGYYIKDRNINILYIGNIKLLAGDINDTDIIEVKFIHNDEIFFYSYDIKNISIDLDENINPEDISIEIIVKDYKTDKEKFNKRFRIELTSKDNKSTLDYELDNTSFIEELIKMGFKKLDDGTYNKINNNIEIIYYNISQTIVINTYGDNKFIINYSLITNIISVSLISNINNSFIITEKYEYNITTKEMKRDTNHGYSLTSVLEILEPYITLRNRYYMSTN